MGSVSAQESMLDANHETAERTRGQQMPKPQDGRARRPSDFLLTNCEGLIGRTWQRLGLGILTSFKAALALSVFRAHYRVVHRRTWRITWK
jgi:hypothetical protein